MPSSTIQLILFGLLGLSFGSFGSVLLARVPEGRSIGGRSRCVSCGHALAWYDLIPLASYLALRGKCRSCGTHIALRYPLLELLTSGLFLFLALHPVRPMLAVFPLAVACFMLLLIAIHDAETQSIPDAFTIALTIAALLFRSLLAWEFGWEMLLSGIGGGAALMIFFAALWLLGRGTWIGSGDILLSGALGLLLGPKLGVLALFLAYIIGAMVALILLALKKIHRKDAMAFGPFLAIGAFIALFFGEEMIGWYVGMMG